MLMLLTISGQEQCATISFSFSTRLLLLFASLFGFSVHSPPQSAGLGFYFIFKFSFIFIFLLEILSVINYSQRNDKLNQELTQLYVLAHMCQLALKLAQQAHFSPLACI